MIGTVFGMVGKEVILKGYAQDFDSAIDSMQFSSDLGQTWTEYPVNHVNEDSNVNWEYSFVPEQVGRYEILIRAVDRNGAVTPEPAHAYVDVREDIEL
ncbi:sulfite oxidase [Slackia exigua]|uniref:sulfite oxidase n=1 Tax=Slackia exigua TaxID=84109 RepID=UPI003AB9A711